MNREATWDLFRRTLESVRAYVPTVELEQRNPVRVSLLGHYVYMTIECGYLLFYPGRGRGPHQRLALPKRGRKRANILPDLEALLGRVVAEEKRLDDYWALREQMTHVRYRYEATRKALPEWAVLSLENQHMEHNFDFTRETCWVSLTLMGRVAPEDIDTITRMWAMMRPAGPPGEPAPTIYQHIEEDER